MKIAILSDIHANRFAFDEVLKDMEKNQCQKAVLLGDLVGYYYWPEYVVSKVKDNDFFIVIKGNHEVILEKCIRDSEFLEKSTKKYGSGFISCISNMSSKDLDWLLNLPDSLQIVIDGVRFGLFHGSEVSYDEYIYPNASDERLNKISSEMDVICFGHTHYPFIRSFNGRLLLNPGSVGQPRDVGSLASYMIYDTENSIVVNKRIPFENKEILSNSKSIDPGNSYLTKVLMRNNVHVQ